MGVDQYHEPANQRSQEVRTVARLIASASSVSEAINWYEQRISIAQNTQAKAIMQNAQQEACKHVGTDVALLLRQKPEWRTILQTVLFKDGDHIEHGEDAEEKVE